MSAHTLVLSPKSPNSKYPLKSPSAMPKMRRSAVNGNTLCIRRSCRVRREHTRPNTGQMKYKTVETPSSSKLSVIILDAQNTFSLLSSSSMCSSINHFDSCYPSLPSVSVFYYFLFRNRNGRRWQRNGDKSERLSNVSSSSLFFLLFLVFN